MLIENNNIQLNKKAILLPITISILLIILKTYGFNQTNSVSIFASLLDSIMDVTISIINMVAIIYAAKPADEDHKFGHNAIEDIVGIIQATFIATSALLIIYKAIFNIQTTQHIQNNINGIIIMSISTIALLGVIIYQRFVISKTNSTIVKSDNLHYTSDILTNITIIISLIITTHPNLKLVDPILALLISSYIIFSAYEIGKRCFDNLMDKELDEEEQTQIREIINNHQGIKGYHKLKTRRSGNRIFVQTHVEIDQNLTFKEAHKITDQLERKLLKTYQNSEIIIHSDPY